MAQVRFTKHFEYFRNLNSRSPKAENCWDFWEQLDSPTSQMAPASVRPLHRLRGLQLFAASRLRPLRVGDLRLLLVHFLGFVVLFSAVAASSSAL